MKIKGFAEINIKEEDLFGGSIESYVKEFIRNSDVIMSRFEVKRHLEAMKTLDKLESGEATDKEWEEYQNSLVDLNKDNFMILIKAVLRDLEDYNNY